MIHKNGYSMKQDSFVIVFASDADSRLTTQLARQTVSKVALCCLRGECVAQVASRNLNRYVRESQPKELAAPQKQHHYTRLYIQAFAWYTIASGETFSTCLVCSLLVLVTFHVNYALSWEVTVEHRRG